MYVTFTVWNRSSLWATAGKLWVLSFLVCCVVVVALKDPAALKVSRFGEISNFLRVFVGLLLGFFMSASVNRWWACVEAFLALCGVCRKLQMALNSCGVAEEHKHKILHYGVISAWILHHELHVQALPDKDQEDANRQGWASIARGEDLYEDFTVASMSEKKFTVMTEEESVGLQRLSDPSGTLWVWIGAYVGQLAQDGQIKTLAPPAFARCMALSGEGLDKILKVRSMITVQAPYIYVQMLSSLVHINNIVNAFSFGMTAGSSLATFLAWKKLNPVTTKQATEEQTVIDLQSLMVSFFFSVFGPFIYQALLEVSIAIAQPFSNEDAVVPTKRMLKALVKDLHDGFRPGFPTVGTVPAEAVSINFGFRGDEDDEAEGEGDEAGP